MSSEKHSLQKIYYIHFDYKDSPLPIAIMWKPIIIEERTFKDGRLDTSKILCNIDR